MEKLRAELDAVKAERAGDLVNHRKTMELAQKFFEDELAKKEESVELLRADMRRHEQAHHNALKELDSEKLSHGAVGDELNRTIAQLKEKATSLESAQLEGDRQYAEKLEAALEGGAGKGKKPAGKPKTKKRKK